MNDLRPTTKGPITIAPVRKSIRVNTRQARAFDVFTDGLGRWWPKHGNNRPAPIKTVILEPRSVGTGAKSTRMAARQGSAPSSSGIRRIAS